MGSESTVVFTLGLLGLKIPVTDTAINTAINMWIVMVVLTVSVFILTRNLKLIPEGKQNLAETIVEFINNLVRDIIGHHWKHFSPYLGTILLFLLVSNTISIFNIIPTGSQLYELTHMEFFRNWPQFRIEPPTKNVNVTVTMAGMTILLVIVSGIRFKSFKGWLRSFILPVPVMLPFNIMDYGIRILSLTLRLYGNILAAFIVMELIYGVAAPIVPAFLSLYFDLFDGCIQAYIFVFLSTIYISEAVE